MPQDRVHTTRLHAFAGLLVLLALALPVGWGPLAVHVSSAQSGPVVPVRDHAYRLIRALQLRGHMLELHPTRLPYTSAEIAAAVAQVDKSRMNRYESAWLDQLERRFRVRSLHAEIGTGAVIASSKRPEALRPLADRATFYQNAVGYFGANFGRWYGQFGLRHDGFYKLDPDALPAVNRLIMRGDQTYFSYASRHVFAHFGRIELRWAPVVESALVLSDNTASLDAISFRLGNGTYSLTGVLAELDSVTGDGEFTGRAGAVEEPSGSRRRFLSAHRFDYRPWRNVVFTGVESVLYSGPSSGFSLKYLNPLQPFFVEVDNSPKNDENNGFVGGQLWLYLAPVTLSGQIVFDDFDVLGEGDEPPSMALAGSIAAPLRRLPVDVGLTATLIASRTYNTGQPEGKYIYLLRGLGTQYNDFVHARVFADIYAFGTIPGLTISPAIDLLFQGEEDIRSDFPGRSDGPGFVATGVVEQTVRLGSTFHWQPLPHAWIRADLGYNLVTDVDHVSGVSDTRFAYVIEIGLRLFANWRSFD